MPRIVEPIIVGEGLDSDHDVNIHRVRSRMFVGQCAVPVVILRDYCVDV